MKNGTQEIFEEVGAIFNYEPGSFEIFIVRTDLML